MIFQEELQVTLLGFGLLIKESITSINKSNSPSAHAPTLIQT